MNKVIVLDWGIFLHRSIWATLNNPNVPSTYTCLNMIFGCLKRIGIEEDDTVLVAVDFLKSWRKQYEEGYKADRKQKKDESPIDWKYQYGLMNDLLLDLEEATNWHVIKLEHIEADDIMAVASRTFTTKEVILVTYDSDLEQCWHYPNVKIFSPKTKRYKIPPAKFNVYELIAKKINKEASDNLVNPILTKADYHNRLTCINLLELPNEVEDKIKEALNNLQPKISEPELLPFSSLIPRYKDLYVHNKIETYEHSVKYKERKEKQKKNKRRTKK